MEMKKSLGERFEESIQREAAPYVHPLVGTCLHRATVYASLTTGENPRISEEVLDYRIKNVTEHRYVLLPVDANPLQKRVGHTSVPISDVAAKIDDRLLPLVHITTDVQSTKDRIGLVITLTARSWVASGAEEQLARLRESLKIELRELLVQAQDLQLSL